jgi:hypothetical protein
MSRPLVEQIADAVLYEGYLLYPYRPSSVKNRQRWTFGGVYPRAYAEAQAGADAWRVQAECLLTAGADSTLTVRVRFLQMLERQPGELTPPLAAWPAEGEPSFRPVPLLRVGDRSYPAWQEAVEREARLDALSPERLTTHSALLSVSFSPQRNLERLADQDGTFVGVLCRTHEQLDAEVEASTRRLEMLEGGAACFRVAVRVRNTTALPTPTDREAALPHAMLSTHAVLSVSGGAFVSLLDPPPRWREQAAGCRNAGLWPVLAGEAGGDTVLASPIILYDHPQVAPESPGDLFDATEIDEILILRVLTMTDEEKREMCAADERARRLLERTEALARDQLLGLHGTFRPLPGPGGTT